MLGEQDITDILPAQALTFSLRSTRGAPPGEVVAAISETLFNADFADLHRLADQFPGGRRQTSESL